METSTLQEFQEFGQRIYYVAICFVLQFIPFVNIVAAIAGFIIMLQSLGNIKRINEKLHNPNLAEFRSKYLMSIIIGFVGALIIVFTAIPLVFALMMSDSYPSMYTIFPAIMLAVIGGVIIAFISGYLLMKAWENLNTFFTENQNLFPPHIARDAIDGTKNLRTAALLQLLFFLIITGIIAVIFMILGYFKLANLKDLPIDYSSSYEQPIPESVTAPRPQEPPAAAQTTSKPQFCPHCGAKLDAGAKFCAKCGSKVE